jgi:hypothetical protein
MRQIKFAAYLLWYGVSNLAMAACVGIVAYATVRLALDRSWWTVPLALFLPIPAAFWWQVAREGWPPVADPAGDDASDGDQPSTEIDGTNHLGYATIVAIPAYIAGAEALALGPGDGDVPLAAMYACLAVVLSVFWVLDTRATRRITNQPTTEE